MSVCALEKKFMTRGPRQDKCAMRATKKDGSQGVWQHSGWQQGRERRKGRGKGGGTRVALLLLSVMPSTFCQARHTSFSINSRKRKCWWRCLELYPSLSLSLSFPVCQSRSAYACALSDCLPACQWHFPISESNPRSPPYPSLFPSMGRASVICLAVIAGVLPLTATEPAAAAEEQWRGQQIYLVRDG